MKKIFSFIFLMIMSLGMLCSCGMEGLTGPQGPQGEQGPQGDKGDKGDQGEPGKNGTDGKDGQGGHTPVITIGENGNWYIDGVDTEVKATGDNGASGEVGPQGPQGQPGKDGTSLLSGNGEPSTDLGMNGDSYIDLDKWYFYVKIGGIWSLKGNIKGEAAESREPDHNGTEGLVFYPINDNECAVAVGRAKLLKEIVIPSKYKNYTVTTIYGNASSNAGFKGCDNLEKVTLPATLRSISPYAFAYCERLTSVVISEESELGSIGEYAFYECTSLTGIVVPKSVTSIGRDAFKFCHSLTSVLFSEESELESIGEYAFASCLSLKAIEIPNTVTSIKENAFFNCSSLTSITIPDSVISMGESVFSSCYVLSIYCASSSKPNGWNYNWNSSGRPVYWAGKWEYDANGNPVPLK